MTDPLDFAWRYAGGPDYAPRMKMNGWGLVAMTQDCDGDFATLIIKAGDDVLLDRYDFSNDYEAMRFAEEFIRDRIPGLRGRTLTSNVEEWR